MVRLYYRWWARRARDIRASSTATSIAGCRRAHDLIHDAYAEPLDLDTLARAAGVSRYHFLRSFARASARRRISS